MTEEIKRNDRRHYGTFLGEKIVYDEIMKKYTCAGYQNSNLPTLKSTLEKTTKETIDRVYFMRGDEGIIKLMAGSRWFSISEQEYMIRARSIDIYNREEYITVSEKKIFPNSTRNNRWFERSVALRREAILKIEEAEGYSAKLQRS